ncbi:MAG: GNAT family N-acetyltransferase [Streptococcaceae bacterium]|jgi:ribosomal-protein-alanine N-acetyltransferase|nr:GNAT family N-acetyltransferase [Streptococcaceae bacterium]
MKEYIRILAENTYLETKKLYLRPIKMEDELDLFEMTSSPLINQYVLLPQKDLKEYIAKIMYQPLGIYAIEEKLSKKMVGMIEFHNLKNKQAEVIYFIHQSFWGKGYASESLEKIIEVGFQELRLKKIIAEHDRENVASGKVMEKVGMVKIGMFRKYDQLTKTIRPFVRYEIEKR